MSRKFSVVAILLAALVSTACSSQAAPPAGNLQTKGDGLIPASKVVDPNSIAKALDFANPSAVAEQARTLATSNCLEALGFTFTPPKTAEVDIYMAMGIPRITEQQALQDGYPKSVFGANEQTEANDVDLSKALYGPADSPKVSAVLGDTEKSISGSGCFADGFKKVYGTIADGMLATGLATDSIHGATLSAAYDDDLGAANAEWAGCIKGTPFPELEGPGAAYAFAQDNPDQALAVAEVDSECREKVNFNQKLDLVIEKYLTTYLHNMEPYINQIQSIRAKAEVRGRSILGG